MTRGRVYERVTALVFELTFPVLNLIQSTCKNRLESDNVGDGQKVHCYCFTCLIIAVWAQAQTINTTSTQTRMVDT